MERDDFERTTTMFVDITLPGDDPFNVVIPVDPAITSGMPKSEQMLLALDTARECVVLFDKEGKFGE